jgi:hypothetical protein
VKPPLGTRRYFFTPSGDGAAWEMTEALRTKDGWEVRQAGRLGMRLLPDVPSGDADWIEARAPSRAPRLPKPKPAAPTQRAADSTKTTKTASAKSVKPVAPPVRKVVKPTKPKAVGKPARPAVPPEKLPSLSQELEGLLADEQKRQKAPEGMVKCPACGLPIAPTRNKKVRTHDNPVKGARCEASNKPWTDFP